MNHKASSCHLSRGLPKAKIFGKSSAEACLSLAFKSSEIQSQIFGQRCVLVFYEKRQEAAVNHEASSCHLSRGLPKAKILGLSWSVSIFVLQLRRLKFNVIYLSKFAKTCFFWKETAVNHEASSCHLTSDLLNIWPIQIFFWPNIQLWIRT